MKNKKSFFRMLENIFSGITGEKTKIYEIYGEDLAYTSKNKCVYLNITHQLLDKLKEKRKQFFLLGVFTHEMLHQIYTNFTLYEVKIKQKKGSERKIFQSIANIIEDPAIEYQAPNRLTKILVKALHYSILYIHKQTPNLEESKTAFSQFMNALIMFGDAGFLKGKFTFPEAKDIFYQVAPLFVQAVHEPVCEKRMEIAEIIMEKSEPLWKEETNLMDVLNEAMKNKSLMDGEGEGEDGQSNDNQSTEQNDTNSQQSSNNTTKQKSSDLSYDTKDKKYQKILKEIQKELQEKDNAESSDNLVSNEEDDTSNSNNHISDTDRFDVSDENNDDKNNNESCDDNHSADESNNTQSNVDSTNQNSYYTENSHTSTVNNVNEEDTYEEYEPSNEDLKSMEAQINQAAEDIKKELKEKEAREHITDYDIQAESPALQGMRSKNIIVTPNIQYNSMYDDIVAEVQNPIQSLTRYLKRIIIRDREQKVHSKSGGLNIKRYYGPKLTSRVYDRKKKPQGKEDIAIMVVIDESGSMHGPKLSAAQAATVVLTEAFGQLKIPLYALGFSYRSGKVHHKHYVKWGKTKDDRSTLVAMEAGGCNCDGYSIRYAEHILRDYKAKKKLMIVLHDGLPSAYNNFEEGVQDTKKAVRESKKVDIIGIGVDIQSKEQQIMKEIYGDRILFLNDLTKLVSSFVGIITKVMK